jgi:hypothetical protein
LEYGWNADRSLMHLLTGRSYGLLVAFTELGLKKILAEKLGKGWKNAVNLYWNGNRAPKRPWKSCSCPCWGHHYCWRRREMTQLEGCRKLGIRVSRIDAGRSDDELGRLR